MGDNTRILTLKDLKSLIANADNDYGDIDDFKIMLVDATGDHWVAHDMDYLEIDTDNKVIDIGFYK